VIMHAQYKYQILILCVHDHVRTLYV